MPLYNEPNRPHVGDRLTSTSSRSMERAIVRAIERVTEPDVFDPDRTSFTRRMADGHALRMGHALTGFYVATEPGIYKLIRTCCTDADRADAK